MVCLSSNYFNESEFALFERQIEELRTSKSEGWQEKAVQIIQDSRFEDPDLEISRLREAFVLNGREEELLDQAISGLWVSPEKTKMIKAMIGRALEIMSIYKETHHVFIHAQSSSWLVYPNLIKEILHVKNPGQDYESFQFLRMPNSGYAADITTYRQGEDVWDHEPNTREDLISADGYLYHHESYESAMHFMSINDNILSYPTAMIQKAIQQFYPAMPFEEVDTFTSLISEQAVGDTSIIGNLFTFCIPKEKSEEIQYRSHPFGNPCRCHPLTEDRVVLDLLQEGVLNEASSCKAWDNWDDAEFWPEQLWEIVWVWARTKEEDLPNWGNVIQEYPELKAFKERVRLELEEALSSEIPNLDSLKAMVKTEIKKMMTWESYWEGPAPQYRLFTPALTQENGVKAYLIPSNLAYQNRLVERIRGIVQTMHTMYGEKPSLTLVAG